MTDDNIKVVAKKRLTYTTVQIRVCDLIVGDVVWRPSPLDLYESDGRAKGKWHEVLDVQTQGRSICIRLMGVITTLTFDPVELMTVQHAQVKP